MESLTLAKMLQRSHWPEDVVAVLEKGRLGGSEEKAVVKLGTAQKWFDRRGATDRWGMGQGEEVKVDTQERDHQVAGKHHTA